ncbi:MAG TPA: N-acetyltransferase, partial [Alphaproteobacteria bacterium]|nr:N-acetyltransferase [Alphaproteobacteria bacterium]
MKDIAIRIGQRGNLATLETLYPAAFPDEDLLPLVRALLAEPGSLVLSLVASVGQTLVGHILLTLCGVQGCDAKVALLGPLAVAPDYQQAGVGA